MILYRALANAEIRGDIFARVASEDQIHDFVLAGSKVSDATRGVLLPSVKLGRVSRLFERTLDAGEQFAVSDRLLDEV